MTRMTKKEEYYHDNIANFFTDGVY